MNLCKSESLEHGPGMVSPACSRCHKSRVSVSQSLHLPYVLLENTKTWLSTISQRFAGAQSGPSEGEGHE